MEQHGYYKILSKDIEYTAQISSKGSSNIVWKAIWSSPRGPLEVAAKTCLHFKEQEVIILAKLQHKNIIKFHGVVKIEFPPDRGYVIVTEYAERGSLFNVLHNKEHSDNWPKSNGHFRMKWALEGASALAFIHEQGYQHGDVKSPNFVITQDNTLKILDFGTAREHTYTVSTYSVRGSWPWMAPEVMGDITGFGLQKNSKVTLKADVFSFAVVIWELITGKVPFEEKNQLEIYKAVAETKERLEIPGDCPEYLRSLLTNCWKDDHKVRPSMDEVMEVLKDVGRESCQLPTPQDLPSPQPEGPKHHPASQDPHDSSSSEAEDDNDPSDSETERLQSCQLTYPQVPSLLGSRKRRALSYPHDRSSSEAEDDDDPSDSETDSAIGEDTSCSHKTDKFTERSFEGVLGMKGKQQGVSEFYWHPHCERILKYPSYALSCDHVWIADITLSTHIKDGKIRPWFIRAWMEYLSDGEPEEARNGSYYFYGRLRDESQASIFFVFFRKTLSESIEVYKMIENSSREKPLIMMGITVHILKKNQERGGLTQEHGGLTQEHGGLTQEHGGLTQEQGRLTQEHGGLTQEQGRLTQEQGRLTQEQGNKLKLKFNEHSEVHQDNTLKRLSPHS